MRQHTAVSTRPKRGWVFWVRLVLRIGISGSAVVGSARGALRSRGCGSILGVTWVFFPGFERGAAMIKLQVG